MPKTGFVQFDIDEAPHDDYIQVNYGLTREGGEDNQDDTGDLEDAFLDVLEKWSEKYDGRNSPIYVDLTAAEQMAQIDGGELKDLKAVAKEMWELLKAAGWQQADYGKNLHETLAFA